MAGDIKPTCCHCLYFKPTPVYYCAALGFCQYRPPTFKGWPTVIGNEDRCHKLMPIEVAPPAP